MAWRNFDDTDLDNGLGLILYEPGWKIIDYIGNNYPTLTLRDGLTQIKFFESGEYDWLAGTSYDWQSFVDFTRGCTTNWNIEIAHFLEQIGYCDATLANYYATQWQAACTAQYIEFLSMNPKIGMRNKWIARNAQISEAETTNNIEILFSYSQGYVKKNTPWIYFKRYNWRLDNNGRSYLL